MAPVYQIRLRNQYGALVAILDDYLRLDYAHRVNGVGTCTVALPGTSVHIANIEVDGPLEVWRADHVEGIDWYLEWEGLCVSQQRVTDGDGLKTYTLYAVSYLDLLARRIVAHRARSAGASKSGTASTCMWEYVDENAGPHATIISSSLTGAARLRNGITPGLTLGTDPAAGGAWEGAHAFDNLLETCQHIANDASIDFDIVGNGTTTATVSGIVRAVPAFVFQIFNGQRGADRTTTGLDRADGLNSAGYAPVVFALLHGNMATPQYALGRDGSANCVYVLGPGEQAARNVRVRANAGDEVLSPLNLREVARNATNQKTNAALDAVGDRILEEMQPRESFTFALLQVPGTLYGKHYTWGDKVTARYDDIERDKRIIGVRVRVRDTGESIAAQLADVP